MSRGYMEKILRVDLTNRKAEIQRLDKDLCRRYVGGSGLGTKILYDETNAKTDPLGPENLLIFMTGPLTGTGVPGSGRHEVVFKSPLTGIFARSGAGGSWGVDLKRAGFDGVVLTGKAEEPIYLWIHNKRLEFRKANHLWGKDTYETNTVLSDETDRRATSAVIGPAGERLARIAGICHNGRHARMAGRCGGGAVMGSKNLKAVVVYGAQKIEVAESQRLKDYVREVLPHIKKATKSLGELGTAGGIEGYEMIGNFPHKNWTLSNWGEGASKISGEQMAKTILTGRYTCRHCPVACGRVVRVVDGPFAPVDGGGPEYETIAALGSLCLVDSLEAIAQANQLCNRYGLDTMSTGAAIAFAMEAYEKGLITRQDTEGIELKWGDSRALVEMVKKIGEREGIGKLLGEGTRKAALEIGRNSIEFAPNVKGLEPSYHDPRCFFSQALSYATTNRGACHNGSWSHPYEMTLSQPDLGISEPQDRHQIDGKVELTVKLQNLMCVFDSLVLCKFMQVGNAVPVCFMRDFLNLVTGWDIDIAEFMRTGERIFNLQRLYNVRSGVSRKDDFLPPRFLTLKRDKGKLPPMGSLLSEYYEYRGWGEDGEPLPQKIRELDLHHLD